MVIFCDLAAGKVNVFFKGRNISAYILNSPPLLMESRLLLINIFLKTFNLFP